MFNPVADKPDEHLASTIVWFDAFVSNVDRTIKNTNMLIWHRNLWLIDHGASLYFHHSWDNYLVKSREPFSLIKKHVLFKYAKYLKEADTEISPKLTNEIITNIIDTIPDEWINDSYLFEDSNENRIAYFNYLTNRLSQPHSFLEEALHEQ